MAKVATKAKTKNRDRKFLESAPEISIFMACFAMRNSLLDLDRARADSSITPAQFSEQCNSILDQFHETAEATHRFDIIIPVRDDGSFSSFFWRWFHWWDDYLKTIPAQALRRISDLALDRRPGLDQYRPEGDWVNYHTSRPGFSIVKA